MKTGGFFKSNWTYLLWCALYVTIVWFILGATFDSFILTIILYAISIAIALSPVGEVLLRYIEGARKVVTLREQEFLLPIFEEVYERAREENPNLGKVEIFIIDVMYVNAFAMGNKTIAVTQGLIQSMGAEEIKGVLSHEFGHMANHDTKVLLINVVGNGIFSLALILLKLALFFIQLLARAIDKTGIGDLLLGAMRGAVNIASILFLWLGQIILSLNSRRNEYLADEFAYKLGYGAELVEALYILQGMSMGGKIGVLDRLKASHPYLADRIARLETMITGVEITVR